MHDRRARFITYIIDLFRRNGRGELEENNVRDRHDYDLYRWIVASSCSEEEQTKDFGEVR